MGEGFALQVNHLIKRNQTHGDPTHCSSQCHLQHTKGEKKICLANLLSFANSVLRSYNYSLQCFRKYSFSVLGEKACER